MLSPPPPELAPESPPQERVARMIVLLAPLAFLASLAAMIADIEPFASWFYVFAWWSYILVLDGWVYLRRGSSMLLSRPRAFLLLLPWSSAFWLFFEVVNWRLDNWYYVGLPSHAIGRFLGILISFATVLPGVFETADLLSTWKLFERRRGNGERWRVTPERAQRVALLGWAFLILPLLFPRYAFPLIWGATCLIFEARLARRGEPSLWTHLARGRPAIPLRLLLAGAICGLCWESWNYWAAAKWIYTVPFFEEHKLFEMPFAGFLGFPPFALECYTFARMLVAARLVPEWEAQRERRLTSARRQNAWALGALLICFPAIWGVERWTMRSTATTAVERESLDAAALSLDRTALMGARGRAWLASVNVTTIEELASREVLPLIERLQSNGHGPSPRPSAPEVRVWSRAARRTR